MSTRESQNYSSLDYIDIDKPCMLKGFHLEPHLHSYLLSNDVEENRNCHLTQYEILKESLVKSLYPGTGCMGLESRSSSIAFVTRILRVTLSPVTTGPFPQPSKVVYSSQFSPEIYLVFNRLAPTVDKLHQ